MLRGVGGDFGVAAGQVRKRRAPKGKAVVGVPELTGETFGSLERIARDVFGLELYRDQVRVLEALERPYARVAWAACHGAGKTLIQGVAEVAFPSMYGDGIVKDTATTLRQVKSQVWKEVHKLLVRAKMRHPGLGWPEPQRTRWYPDEKARAYRYAEGVTAENEAAFQGEHGTMLFNVNEAQAVEDHIFRAIDNNRAAGDIRELRVGNTTTTQGAFHDSFNAERHLWTCIRTTAWDTPNLAGWTPETLRELSEDDPRLMENPWPTITRKWVWEKLRSWGEDHPLYRIKVMAEFPEVDAYGYVSASWLEAAERDLPEGDWKDLPLIAAVDPAGPGKDETACVAMRGGQIVSQMATVEEDARGPVIAWLRGLGQVACVPYDPVGLGHYMGKHIKDHGYVVRPVHPQEVAKQPRLYKKRKDEMAWEVREDLEKGRIGGMTDEKLQAQLLTMRWGVLPSGETAMETKAQREVRSLKSPDRAEAFIMARASGGRERVRLFGQDGLNAAVVADSGQVDAWRPPLADMLSMKRQW